VAATRVAYVCDLVYTYKIINRFFSHFFKEAAWGLSRTDPSEKGLSGTDPSEMGLSGTDPSQMGLSGTDPVH